MLTLAQLLDDTAHDDNHEAIHASAGIVRWGELAESFAQERQRLRALAGSRLGLSFAATRSGIARLAAIQAVGAHVFLIDHGLSEDTRREWAERYELRALLDSSPNDIALSLPNTTAQAPTAEADDQAGSVTILTSGSTGEPKAVQHA
ncbi:MAG: hypothetical protein KDA92_15655, partial [Planctomycetales bacterium]|nr:hypothetical protein [Planctomycetales bacterium]